MISTDDRSPSGRDSSTTRLNTFNNNENEENSSLYYQYVHERRGEQQHHQQGTTLTTSQSTPVLSLINSPPPSSHSPSSLDHHHHQQIVLRDPNSSVLTHHHHHFPDSNSNNITSSSASLALLPSSSPPAAAAQQQQYGISDFIQHTLSSRLIPKLGSIVKRFSLNYSGEGLVTDRQRTRTVRVGIRFQVQVDSFVNNNRDGRPRAILRTQSAPAVEQLDSGFSSPTTDVFPQNRQLALEYNNTCGGSGSISQSNSSSTLSVADYCSSGAASSTSGGGVQIGIGSGVDSCSSGVSSEASSPTLERRANNNSLLSSSRHHHHSSLPFAQQQQQEHHQQHSTSNTLAFHNRINQALNSYRTHQQNSLQQEEEQRRARRSSVHVYRRGSASPERSNSISSEDSNSVSASAAAMEDSSSYQVLRHFPGSNVNSLNELSWETAAFEKEIRDRIQWLGDKISSIRVPRVVSQLVDFGREYARENPVTALILLALCLTSSAPVLIFLVFAVATILVTFLGFLFVEGTLLTAGTVIFGGVILLVGFVTLSAVLLGMLGYFTTTQAYLVVTGRSQVFRLLRKLPVIGRFFPEPPPAKVIAAAADKDDDDNESITQYVLANGFVPNGKLANGHVGSCSKSTPYYVDEEDDDDEINDILESDDDVHIVEEEIIKKTEKEEESSGAVTTSDLSTSSDLGVEDEVEEEEEEEDLGNQEIISNDDGVGEEGDLAQLDEKGVSATPTAQMNGHHEKCVGFSEEESENVEESTA